MHREGSIENLKEENELLIQLQADKKAEKRVKGPCVTLNKLQFKPVVTKLKSNLVIIITLAATATICTMMPQILMLKIVIQCSCQNPDTINPLPTRIKFDSATLNPIALTATICTVMP